MLNRKFSDNGVGSDIQKLPSMILIHGFWSVIAWDCPLFLNFYQTTVHI